jgi:hypothetical protein
VSTPSHRERPVSSPQDDTSHSAGSGICRPRRRESDTSSRLDRRI